MKRKGLSPVIATVLLIAMVVVIALIIFLWFRGLVGEAITKFGEKNIKLVCDDVRFQASYAAGTLSISNTGTVPIYSINLRIVRPGSYTTEDLRVPQTFVDINWPDLGLNQGEAFAADIGGQLPSDTNEMVLVPILVGKSKQGEETHICEDRHGYKISL